MKKTSRVTFFIVLTLILALTYCAFFGVYDYYGDTKNTYIKGAGDIRWGIDIKGGVEAVFTPDIEDADITEDKLDAAKKIIDTRLVNKNITDYEIYTDTANSQIIVRFPWDANESNFDPASTVEELGETALMSFIEGTDKTGTVILEGNQDIKNASASVDENNRYVVALEFTDSGKTKFANATTRLSKEENAQISIWMNRNDDDAYMVTSATVGEPITDGRAVISSNDGSFTAEYVTDLADTIRAGALPFALSVDEAKLQVISPTLGNEALKIMVIAGAIALVLICAIMIIRYRIPGFVATIALLGQVGGMVAAVSGFFGGASSFTLTIPGIAGMILSIGIGVDCNVIASERIIDEFKKGKTIDGAINAGFKNSFSAILDGNVTVVIVSLVLMGAFGTPDSIMAKIFSPIMFMFSSSIAGSIYSFGYTLLMGVVFNFIMGVFASRLMLKSISQFKFLRKPQFYGGAKNA